MQANTAAVLKTEELELLCHQYQVKRLYAFGSLVSGTFTDKSDLDFLVEFCREETTDAFSQFMGFKEQLELLYKRPVDLLTNRIFRNPVFQEELERTKELIYAA